MPLLLDTHVLIWLMIGDRSLSADATRAIEEAKLNEGVYVPVICFWEVAMLAAKGRLQLGQHPLDWAREVLDKPGVRLAELSVETAILSANLPGIFHRDPADQIIVATARALGAALVTHDRAILRYAAEGHVQVLAA